MGKRKGPLQAGVENLLASIARLKAKAAGRLWDELHYCESRLRRAADGRKSSFTYSSRKRRAAMPKRRKSKKE